MSTPINNEWFAKVIEQAKQSALPILVKNIFIEPDDETEVDTVVDAIELALMSVSGEITEEKVRQALKSFSEGYASESLAWETIADAIMGTLEWTVPDPKLWALNSWR